MTAIKFQVLPKTAFQVFTDWELRSYTDPRPGVLEDIDIFKRGKRSEGHPSDFSLFEESDEADILVFPFYLELFEFFGKARMVVPLVEAVCAAYPSKRIVVQWNHDLDFAKRFPALRDIKNLTVLNFNTSERSDNDVVLPFWTLDTNALEEEKKHKYGFIGEITHLVRGNLYHAFRNDSECFLGSKLEYQEFRKTVSSCRFSFCPRGAGLSSWRFFECMHLNTVPVLFADDVELPFPDLDYSEFCVRLPEEMAGDRQAIVDHLQSVDDNQMLTKLREVRGRFTLKGVQEEVHKCLLNL